MIIGKGVHHHGVVVRPDYNLSNHTCSVVCMNVNYQLAYSVISEPVRISVGLILKSMAVSLIRDGVGTVWIWRNV